MRFARINRNERVIRYTRTITSAEISDLVYVLRLFDNSQYINVAGYFIDQKDIQLMAEGQSKGNRYIRKIEHLYSVAELYDRIYEGWGFCSNNSPAKLICKRKYPYNSAKHELRLVNITKKYRHEKC